MCRPCPSSPTLDRAQLIVPGLPLQEDPENRQPVPTIIYDWTLPGWRRRLLLAAIVIGIIGVGLLTALYLIIWPPHHDRVFEVSAIVALPSTKHVGRRAHVSGGHSVRQQHVELNGNLQLKLNVTAALLPTLRQLSVLAVEPIDANVNDNFVNSRLSTTSSESRLESVDPKKTASSRSLHFDIPVSVHLARPEDMARCEYRRQRLSSIKQHDLAPILVTVPHRIVFVLNGQESVSVDVNDVRVRC